MGERTLRHAFERAVRNHPDEVFLSDDHGRTYTFTQSWERSLRIAAGLHAHGVGHQRTVAMLLDNSLDIVHSFFGIGLGGMIEIPINTAYKGRFLSHLLNDSEASLLIIESDYIERLDLVAADLTSLRTVVVRGDLGAADVLRDRFEVVPLEELETHGAGEPAAADAADIVAYMYTSGTTGLSKGVVTTHAQAYTYSTREDRARPVPEAGDKILASLPLFHLAGQWFGVYQALIQQVPCVIGPRFAPTTYWDTVRAHGITSTVMLGAVAEMLFQQPPDPRDADNPMNLVIMAPLASDIKGFCSRFDVEAEAGFGMSEVGLILVSPHETLVGGEAGFARDMYDFRIVDEAGHDVEPGAVGELWVRPHDPLLSMQRYHNLPEKTAETMIDGWIRTGDAFRVDDEGRYFFIDRMKDSLRRRGENISSFEVESTINEFPDVYESAVVAVPADLVEDEILAVVAPHAGRTIDPVELSEFLIERLPYFMVPRFLRFVDVLPKTPTQKIQKNILRATGTGPDVWDRQAAGISTRR
jgi:crotonobetaine/carnitine-CoA ligase